MHKIHLYVEHVHVHAAQEAEKKMNFRLVILVMAVTRLVVVVMMMMMMMMVVVVVSGDNDIVGGCCWVKIDELCPVCITMNHSQDRVLG